MEIIVKIKSRNYTGWLEHLARMTTLNEFLRMSKINLKFIPKSYLKLKNTSEYLTPTEKEALKQTLAKVNDFEISMDFCRFLFDSFEKELKTIIRRILKSNPDLNKKKTKFIFEIIDAACLTYNENVILLFEVYKQVEKLGHFGRFKKVRTTEFSNTKMVFDHYKLFM